MSTPVKQPVHEYDRRVAATFDPSVLGYTQSELEDMSVEERGQALQDSLNQAADLLQATVSAFSQELDPSQKGDLKGAAREIIGIVRSLK